VELQLKAGAEKKAGDLVEKVVGTNGLLLLRFHSKSNMPATGAEEEVTEEEAMESFVQADFMSHPGVSASNSAGAIGIMAVKKTPYGYFLQFAHNTDSFALASMHSNEKEPKCVMSRLKPSPTPSNRALRPARWSHSSLSLYIFLVVD
jgi:hypothetical protein